MLNEKKVRLMTRMAMYESKEGKEDLKISSYYKKDYKSFHTIITVIWVTIGFVIALGIGALAWMDELFARLDMKFLILFGATVIIGYLVLAIIYGISASRFYGKKYDEARQRVKIFNHDLTRLSRMYERESE